MIVVLNCLMETKKGNKKAIKSFAMIGMTYLAPGYYNCYIFVCFYFFFPELYQTM